MTEREFPEKSDQATLASLERRVMLLAAEGFGLDEICQRLGLPADPRKFTPHVTLARLRNARLDDVVSYLSGRGNFYSSPFMVNRFVLMSSKESVGGGPYVTEEVFPLYEGGSSFGLSAMEAHPR